MPIESFRATISWEGDSRKVLGQWPKPIKAALGGDLDEMQQGKAGLLPVRPMPSIGAGVFELKDSDEKAWYRVIYLARVRNTIYVLHCFTKDTAKTEKHDLATAKQRLKHVQQRLQEDKRNAKKIH